MTGEGATPQGPGSHVLCGRNSGRGGHRWDMAQRVSRGWRDGRRACAGAAGATVRVSQGARTDHREAVCAYVESLQWRPGDPRSAVHARSPAQPEGGRPTGQGRGLLTQPPALLKPSSGPSALPVRC